MLTAFSTVPWLVIHWTFTSHYLLAASLFQLSFAQQTPETERKIKRRKTILLVIDAIIYAGLLSGFLVLTFYDFQNRSNFHRVTTRFLNVNLFIFTLISISSMVYI